MAGLEHEGAIVAVAGFRVMEMLSTGRTLYVDDLVTDPAHHSRGHGKAMLDWLQKFARQAGCETFSLDSGTFRHDAHAFTSASACASPASTSPKNWHNAQWG